MKEFKYRGIVYCMRCGKKYKPQQRRKKKVYICSGYSNYGKNFCKRGQIDEEDLDFVIERNGGDVERIEVYEEEIKIIYKNKEISFIKPEKILIDKVFQI